MESVERWSLHRGGLFNKYDSAICHLWDIIIMWSLHRGGLCTEVVFIRLSLIIGFTLAFICIKLWLFPFSISGFHFHCFQLPTYCTRKICYAVYSEKNYASFYCLTGRWMDSPMDKSWLSTCSPVHREFINVCFIYLQIFVYVVVTKEFRTIFFQ